MIFFALVAKQHVIIIFILKNNRSTLDLFCLSILTRAKKIVLKQKKEKISDGVCNSDKNNLVVFSFAEF